MSRERVPRLCLVSCVARKRARPASARELYVSDWFKKARAYAETRGAPWFILSAEHGLVRPDEEIAPYEKTLKAMGATERRRWAEKVIGQMERSLPGAETIAVLTGKPYREHLMGYLRSRAGRVETPLGGHADRRAAPLAGRIRSLRGIEHRLSRRRGTVIAFNRGDPG